MVGGSSKRAWREQHQVTIAMSPDEVSAEIRRRVGVTNAWNTAALRRLRQEFSRSLRTADGRFVLKLALHLLAQPQVALQYRFLAYELVTYHSAALSGLRTRDVEALGQGIDHWAAVDTFGCYISGPAWRERQLADAVIHRWARSRDRWWRRAALVSTVPLNCKARGGNGDTARTLAACSLLLEDRDDMVVKAMSWALRELAKRDADAVKGFLASHGAMLAPSVIREVRNKLVTGLKNPRRS
jgi:3-methyladenine DNA glycosylase AlkD